MVDRGSFTHTVICTHFAYVLYRTAILKYPYIIILLFSKLQELEDSLRSLSNVCISEMQAINKLSVLNSPSMLHTGFS